MKSMKVKMSNKTARSIIIAAAKMIAKEIGDNNTNCKFTDPIDAVITKSASVRIEVELRAVDFVDEVLRKKNGEYYDFKTHTESRGVYQKRSIKRNAEKVITALLIAAEMARTPRKDKGTKKAAAEVTTAKIPSAKVTLNPKAAWPFPYQA
jgi:hypothetical protein